MSRHPRQLTRVLAIALAALAVAGCASSSTLVNRDGARVDRSDPGHVEMRLPAGRPFDYAAELSRWNAPRVMQHVRGDFVVETQVSGNFNPGTSSTADKRKAYHGAGLLVIGDQKNHVSLQRGALAQDRGSKARQYLNFEVRRNGKCVVSRNAGRLDPDQDVFLRLERRDGRILASVSDDGTNWRNCGSAEDTLPDSVEVGVEAVSSSSRGLKCEFDNFRVLEPATR